MNLNKDLQVAGYVMIPRALLLRAFEENREAVGDMNAFLRVLTYVNYAEGMTKCCNIEVACRRGESVISFSHWAACADRSCRTAPFGVARICPGSSAATDRRRYCDEVGACNTERETALGVVQEFYAFPHDVIRCQYSHRGAARYKRRLFSEYHRCFQVFALAFCEDRQCGDAYHPGGFRVDGLCEGQPESAFHPFRIDYYGDGCDVCYLFRAGTVPAFSRCLAVHTESLPVYRISYFPDSFLRPVHCLFQDSWECRVLYCDDGLFRMILKDILP